MAKWVTHSHDDGLPFRSDDEYMRGKSCTVCSAQPGWHCLIGSPRPEQKFHTRRQDRGMTQYRNDYGKAPWPEEREPGVCYSTIVGLCV